MHSGADRAYLLLLSLLMAPFLPWPTQPHPTDTRLHHALSLDDLLRDLNHQLQQQAQQQQQQQGGAAAPRKAAAGGVSRAALINALRQLDDLVVFDQLTNTVRSVNRPAQQAPAQGGAAAAKEAEAAAAQAAAVLAAAVLAA